MYRHHRHRAVNTIGRSVGGAKRVGVVALGTLRHQDSSALNYSAEVIMITASVTVTE